MVDRITDILRKFDDEFDNIVHIYFLSLPPTSMQVNFDSLLLISFFVTLGLNTSDKGLRRMLQLAASGNVTSASD